MRRRPRQLGQERHRRHRSRIDGPLVEDAAVQLGNRLLRSLRVRRSRQPQQIRRVNRGSVRVTQLSPAELIQPPQHRRSIRPRPNTTGNADGACGSLTIQTSHSPGRLRGISSASASAREALRRMPIGRNARLTRRANPRRTRHPRTRLPRAPATPPAMPGRAATRARDLKDVRRGSGRRSHHRLAGFRHRATRTSRCSVPLAGGGGHAVVRAPAAWTVQCRSSCTATAAVARQRSAGTSDAEPETGSPARYCHSQGVGTVRPLLPQVSHETHAPQVAACGWCHGLTRQQPPMRLVYRPARSSQSLRKDGQTPIRPRRTRGHGARPSAAARYRSPPAVRWRFALVGRDTSKIRGCPTISSTND